MNTWQDAVVQIVLILIGLAFTYISKSAVSVFKGLLQNKQAVSLIEATAPLAKDVVVAVQKLGLDKQLSGAVQKNIAVQGVINTLKNKGFTEIDQKAVEDAVERAYAELKSTLDKVYSDASKDGVGKTDATAVEAPVAKVDTPTEASGSTDTSTK
ncbi:putative holin [Lactobacillus phage Lb338-1]|uniref:Putative holin n=1 Tax=Lactobacillus phage Lb338-1 TaxID=2892342 RepID=C1KFN6_9CAUD|nr:holin [Lactobacillus phage Lb338-1]ACO37047.1 putative holin [Lactobacillus phage Lb338-1]